MEIGSNHKEGGGGAMMRKLRENRGETLVETFAAIVVATLSVALLFGGIVASGEIERNAKRVDEDHYEAFNAAEGQGEPLTETATVTITNSSNISTQPPIIVDLYGGSGVYSYKKKG